MMSSGLTRVTTPLRHVALAVGVVTIVSVSSVIVGGEGAPGLGSRLVLGVGLGACGGLALGLAQAVAWSLLGALSDYLELDAWAQRVNDRDRSAPRAPVVELRAGLVAASVMLVVFGAAAWVLMPSLFHIANPAFARSFAVLLFVGLGGGALVGGFVLARLLRPLVARIDERLGLPWPASPALRYALFVVVPVAALLPAYLVINAVELGTFALFFWVLVVLVGEGLVGLVCLPWLVEGERRLSLAVAPVLVLVGAGAASVVMNGSEDASRWAREHRVLGPSAALTSKATDFDRDGFSSMFGGGDCAAFDASISPKAQDIPDNGIDEDCSGEDASKAAEVEALELFYGKYEAPEGQGRPNVLFVIVDAIRFDTTGIGGAADSPTPYLDEAAEDSLVFTQAYSQSSATILSIPSMLSGRDPSMAEWARSSRIDLGDSEQTLGKRLDALGYQTGLVAVSYFNRHMKRILAEFEFTSVLEAASEEEMAAPAGAYVTGQAGALVVESIRYIERAAASKDPWFLTLYVVDPHSEYLEHGFGHGRFGDEPKERYTGEISNVDASMGSLIHYLKHSGQWDNTIFVFLADHGEEFGEHGGVKHAQTCYIESVHVPLIVHVPGVEGQRVDAPVGLLDVAPTILEVIGNTDDARKLDGQSLLLPALAPERAPEDRVIPCSVISQRPTQGNFFRRAARTEDGVLIHNVIAGHYEYYDRTADPGEQTDIHAKSDADPELERLQGWLSSTLSGNLPSNLLTD